MNKSLLRKRSISIDSQDTSSSKRSTIKKNQGPSFSDSSSQVGKLNLPSQSSSSNRQSTPSGALQTGSIIGEGVFRARMGSYLGQSVVVKAVSLLDKTGAALLGHESSVYEYLTPLQGVVIPRVLFSGEYDGSFVLATEFIGSSLSQHAEDSDGDLNKKALEVVEEVHKFSLVHGDLKLENFVVRDGSVFAVDFHLAERARDLGELEMEMIAARLLFPDTSFQ